MQTHYIKSVIQVVALTSYDNFQPFEIGNVDDVSIASFIFVYSLLTRGACVDHCVTGKEIDLWAILRRRNDLDYSLNVRRAA